MRLLGLDGRFSFHRIILAVRGEISRVFLLDRPLRVHVLIWLLGGVSVITTGYRFSFYADNHAIQIPQVLEFNDPSLFPRDSFVETLDLYPTAVWPVVALLARTIPLEALFLALFVVRRMMLFYAGAYFVRSLAPRSWLAPIAAAAFLATGPVPLIGGASLVRPYFEHTGVSIFFHLLALASVYARRPWAVAAWWALGFSANPMYGLHAATYIGAAWLVDPELRRGPTLGPLVLAGILSLPMMSWSIAAIAVNEGDPATWLQAAAIVVPYHIFPPTGNPEPFRRLILLVFLCICLLYHFRSTEASGSGKVELAWSAVAAVWVGLSLLVVVGVILPTLLAIQPIRGPDLWYLAMGLAVVGKGADRLDREMSVSNLALLLGAFAVLTYLLVPRIGVWPMLVFAGGCLVVMGVLADTPYRRSSGPRWAAIGLVGLLAVSIAGEQAERRRESPLFRRSAVLSGPDPVVSSIARWARHRTRTDAMFMVDPTNWHWAHFRHLARRSVYLTWKDGSALLWDRSFADEWLRRLSDLGIEIHRSPDVTNAAKHRGTKGRLTQAYRRMSDRHKLELAEQRGIDYWIVGEEHDTSLPVVLRRKNIKVLALNRGGVTLAPADGSASRGESTRRTVEAPVEAEGR